MKDLHKLVAECQADLASVGIKHGTVSKWTVNTRAKTRWGLCRKLSNGTYEIEIAQILLQDDTTDIAAKNTIIHELLHTCPGCLNHTGKWIQLAQIVNYRLPMYNIKRTTSADEKGVAVRRKEPVYRYILKCGSCGREIKRQKKSAVIEYPQKYRCVCGGKLLRIR